MREDWTECSLGDLLTLKNGFAFKSSKYIAEGIPVIRIGDINDWIVDESQAKCIAEDKEYDGYIVEKGDILIAMSGATTGKFGIYESDRKAYQNQRVGNLKPSSNTLIDKRYIFNLLYSLKFQIEKDAYGGAQPNISAGKIHALKTLLAPLPEQRAIVAKIEELFSSLDQGIADLHKAQDQLKIYRQAVLKKAFEGELTKEWREQQTDLPTADELLEQIKKVRQEYYEQQLDDWKQAVKAWEENGKEGKKPGKPKTIKALPALTKDELDNLPALNKFWKWSTIDNIAGHEVSSLKAGPFGSSLKKSFYTETGYKIYGQEQVISGDSTIGNYYVNEEKFQSLINCAIAPFDILISLVGTVGKVLVLPEDCEKGIINPRLVKVTLNNFYEPVFFKYYFESSFLKSLYKLKNHGTTMDVLNLGSIKELPYPICSLKEQHQIVQEIESRLSVCDNIEQSISESLDKAQALRQSILKKAFEGTLLTPAEIEKCKQAPDYEPANVLLEKIKNEKKKK